MFEINHSSTGTIHDVIPTYWTHLFATNFRTVGFNIVYISNNWLEKQKEKKENTNKKKWFLKRI